MNDQQDIAKRRKPGRGGPMTFSYGLLPGLIGYHVRRAQVAVFQDFVRSLAELQLTPGQFGVLVLIDANPGLNQTQLGRALGIDRSTVVAVIDRLEGRGLVRRAPSPDDRRSYALRLSAAGKRQLAAALPRVREHEARLARDLSAAEQAQLIALLDRIPDSG
jgi:DNA-binding MarR family transcriptional regulator